MVEEILNKEIAKKLMKIEGEGRGFILKNDATFVRAQKGETGLKKLEKELEKVGCPIKYKEIRSLNFYPVSWRAISLLAMKKVFRWGDEEFRELGRFILGGSLIVRVYARFFHSIEAIVKKAPQMWREYFTVGELTAPDYDEEKRYLIIEIRGLDFDPVFCRAMEGYLMTIVGMVVKAEVRCHETKCTFEGQDHHQFKITWG